MRPGVTLVELIVVLAILGVIAGVTTLAFRTVPPGPRVEPWASAVAQARRTALDSARAVTITLSVNGAPHAVTAMPDGSVIADISIPVDRLTGEPIHAP
jgi:prepilin-type N-terminal cleavage/methylation domain-containing protein